MKFKRRLPADDEAVPMASMADLAFLLIIFFMLTSVFKMDWGLLIELPATSVRDPVELQEIVLTIARDGGVHFDGRSVPLEEVGPLVLETRRRHPQAPVVVRSDRNAAYGSVADVMDELLKAGVRDVALPTAPEEEGR